MNKNSTVLKMGVALLFLFATSPAFSQMTPTDSHKKAAKEVYMLVGGANAAKAAADAMLAAMTANNPEAEKAREVIMKWCTKVFGSIDFENEMTMIYIKNFSEQELIELAKFYKTDLGKKLTASLPVLMKEGAAVGAKHGQLHQDELIKMLSESSK